LPCNAGPVAYSINSGVPIVVSESHHPISVVLNKLSELTFNRWQDKGDKNTEGPTSNRKTKGLGAKLSQKLNFR
jgi:hypothetical protein